jgi:putative ABC transport system ATP-binding protein
MSQLGQIDLVKVRRYIGFIFQLHNLFESLTAYENVKMAMQLGPCPEVEMRQRGVDILSRLGFSKRVDYTPRALSGWQCQRVAVARAAGQPARLLLADEPTASLDKKVVQLFQQLVAEDGCSIMMVTHDNRVLDAADRIINMVDEGLSPTCSSARRRCSVSSSPGSPASKAWAPRR